jgi:hypothetical protein
VGVILEMISQLRGGRGGGGVFEKIMKRFGEKNIDIVF